MAQGLERNVKPDPDGAAARIEASGGKVYACIDLKSFYASVECAARGLDPFTTNLVVADPDRTEKTICLAITPAMKDLGVKNRCRVFEIPAGIPYIMAKPRMSLYMQVSKEIYQIYLRYVSAEDVHVYSIDECFIDITPYLRLYKISAKGFANMLMDAVLEQTGICATAGIGSNLFLAKIALDIEAKHVDDHIGVLDEVEFRRVMWHHRPLTDFWQIGGGIASRLAKFGAYDLYGVTQLEVQTLYREFGVNAELLIDHAWGLEPTTIAQIHSYKSEAQSLSNSQVLPCDYTYDEALMVLREMTDTLVLEMVGKGLATNHVSLSVGYSRTAVTDAMVDALTDDPASGAGWLAGDGTGGGASGQAGGRAARKHGGWAADAFDVEDPWGSTEPEAWPGQRQAQAQVRRAGYAGGRGGAFTGASHKLGAHTNSFKVLFAELERIYRDTTMPGIAIRRIGIAFGNLQDEAYAMCDLFTDPEDAKKERDRAAAVLAVKKRFGKNALLKGTSLKDKATGRERNAQVGGHNA